MSNTKYIGSKYEETKERIINAVVADIARRNQSLRNAYSSFKDERIEVHADEQNGGFGCCHCVKKAYDNIIEITSGPAEAEESHYFHEKCLDNLVSNALRRISIERARMN